MRIRKRQVPLPLSSLSPVPVSDPHFNRSPVVQLRCKHDPHQNLTQQPLPTLTFLPQPSDHPNQPIGANKNCFDSPPPDAAAAQLAQTQNKRDVLVLLQGEDYGRRDEGEGQKSSNDTRKKNILGAEASHRGVKHSQFSSSHQVVGRWCEGEKAFPLKKRRGSFERKAPNNDEAEAAVMEKDKKMKTKMNKKFSALEVENNMNDIAEADQYNKETTKDISFDNNTTTTSTATSGAKKRGRGGALMEGSRCSRVNGRGWRCCQQTLVGYSLCEHHLGKGRLRSMTSVRSRALGSTTTPTTKKNETEDHNYHHRPLPNTASFSSTQHESHKTKLEYDAEDGDGIGDEDDQKPLMMTTKRRMKLGTVKARSISSLLGQTSSNNNNNEASSVAVNNKQNC